MDILYVRAVAIETFSFVLPDVNRRVTWPQQAAQSNGLATTTSREERNRKLQMEAKEALESVQFLKNGTKGGP